MKKIVLAWVAVSLLTGTVFGQEATEKPPAVHKHLPFDMLLGIGGGVDIGAKGLGLKNPDIEKAQIMFNGDLLALNYDLYLLSWLSVSTGVTLAYSTAFDGKTTKKNVEETAKDNFEDLRNSVRDSINSGVFIGIPIAAHINVPFVEWLYAGVGIGLNMPIAVTIKDRTIKGTYYTSFPIDIGFDFAKRETRSGGRLFFRIMPNVNKDYTITTFGLHWQYTNWKIGGKK